MNDTFVEKAKVWDSNPQIITLADFFSAELDRIVSEHSGLSILEFGCGTGLVGLRYAERADSLIMVDTSKAMLDVLRSKKQSQASNVTVHEATLSSLIGQDIETESIDWIISNMALHHVDDIPDLLKMLYNLLKPGGRATIGDLESESGTFHAPEVVPHNGFEPHELSKVFEKAGFTLIKTYTYLTMPKEDCDGVTRPYSGFILDAIRPSPN